MANGHSENLKRYFDDVPNGPTLSREEEMTLARAAKQGCSTSLNTLIETNLRFVIKIAKEYKDFGCALEDLVNEGNVGLIQAAHRFDPERGFRFITYAVWWIRRAILKSLSENAHTVRLPFSQLRKLKEIREIERSLTDDLGRAPTDNEIEEQLTGDLASVDPIHRKGIRIASLDSPLSDDSDECLGDTFEDIDQASAEQGMLESEALDRVKSFFNELNEGERDVIAWRFGLEGCQELTLREVASKIGRSREGVRLIERRALNRMHRKATVAYRAKSSNVLPFTAKRVIDEEPPARFAS